jgi:hypothetical protein
VTTPHDLEAERVAAAMGGYLSCLDLVDHAAPAFQGGCGRSACEHPRPLRSRDLGRPGTLRAGARCCAWRGYDSPGRRPAQARPGSSGGGARRATPTRRALIKGAASIEPPAPRAEPERRLWACGLHPERVRAVLRGRCRAATR